MEGSDLKKIGELLESFVSPLTRAVSSYDGAKTLLLELGYIPPQQLSFIEGFAGSVERLLDIIEDIKKLPDNPSVNEISAIVAEVAALLPDLFKQISELENNLKTLFSGQPFITDTDALTQLPLNLLNYLLVKFIEENAPILFSTLKLFKVIVVTHVEIPNHELKFPYQKYEIDWSKFVELFNNPKNLFLASLRSGTDYFFKEWIEALQELGTNIGLTSFFKDPDLDVLKHINNNPSIGNWEGLKTLEILRIPLAPSLTPDFGIDVYPLIDTANNSFKGIVLCLGLDAVLSFTIAGVLKIDIKVSANISNALGFVIEGADNFKFINDIFESPQALADSISIDVTTKLTPLTFNENNKLFKIGEPNGSRFELESFELEFGIKKAEKLRVFVESVFKNGKIVIGLGSADGFVSSLSSGKSIEGDFNLGIGFSTLEGLYFKGGSGLQIQIPSHITLGPIEIQALTFSFIFQNGGFPLDLSSTIKASLGPLTVVVENIGARGNLTFPENNQGNLGPANFDIGFKPPNGLGISIDAGAVIGGGYLYFDFDKQEYTGALELTIAGFISAKAIGLITTKMPDGSQGFSMLIIITAEFNPAFQLGYGFTLMGVGGLLGLNRTVLLDPLRDGVRTGAINNIMFPQNVVANATRIISDIKAIFPVHEGKFLIGPMAKIGWGTPTLVSISFGLIIEIPGNLAILGVLSVILPAKEAALVKIQVAFVGTIDFDKQMLTFDASLYESSILTMTLEGDMAVRLKWGDNPDFLFTVGGFHPSFTPPPLALPTLKRLAINILNTSVARIRVECYQALTSNTVQFGAKADIFFGLDACSISGYISFDALFQFSPFYFIISVSAGFKLRVVGIDLLSVRIKMSLEGPTPWRAKGTGSITLLFFEVSADFDETWGESRNTTLPDKAILTELVEVLNKKEQWSTALSTTKNLYVSLRPLEASAENTIVLHSAGTLVVQQKLLPFTINIDKIGNQNCSDVKNINITSAKSGSFTLNVKSVNDDFARAQYQKLSDAEKLSKPSFEKMPGGVEISMSGNPLKNGKLVRKKAAYELTIVDKAPQSPLSGLLAEMPLLFGHFLKGNSTAKSPLSKTTEQQLKPFDEKIEVFQSGYSIAFQDTNTLFNIQTRFDSEAEAQTHLQNLVQDQPNLKKQIHIIPNFELQEA